MRSTAPSPADTIPSIPLRSSSIVPSVSQPIIPKSLFSAPSISEPIIPSKSSSLSLSVPTTSSRQLPSPPPSPMNSPARFSVYSSHPTSRCSSMNSTISFSGSLDHRSMARISSPKGSKSVVHLPVIQQQQEQQQQPPSYEKPLPRVPTVTYPPPPPYYQTKEQRAAFLSSAPVRSQVTISPRNKNLTPVATSSLASKSTPSFFTSSMSASTLHLNMGTHYHSTDVNVEKRRWSNDSMKDPKDPESSSPTITTTTSSSSEESSESSPFSVGLNPRVSRYFSDDEEDEYDAYELESPSVPSNTTHNDSYEYFNVERNYSAVMSQGKKSKKKCRL
ncbi:hypothetical protein BGX26_007816, partial [Mortierella sp. AD094]